MFSKSSSQTTFDLVKIISALLLYIKNSVRKIHPKTQFPGLIEDSQGITNSFSFTQPVDDNYPHGSCTVHVLLAISSHVQNLYIQAYSAFKWKSFFLQPINHSILLSVTTIQSLFKKINI